MPDTIQKRRIIFRADGNSRIGLGHVVRSLALAAMLREHFECVFAIQEPDDALKAQIQEVCLGIISLPVCAPSEERYTYELAAYTSEEEIVVLDGYTFDTAYQKTIKSRGAQLVCIDDIHAYPFVADVIINHAGGVDAATYKTAAYTKLLLGPQYALLRSPFLSASKQNRSIPKGAPTLFLNLGGADPENYTLKLAKEIDGLQKFESIEIVVGSSYKHEAELTDWLQDHPTINLHSNLDAAQMCRLMQQAAVAVTSASGVAYEYAAVGGLLFILQTADNQAALNKFFIQAGIAKAYSAQSLLLDIAVQFEDNVAVQKLYFDGKSDKRLQEIFQQLDLSASLTLREATITDLHLVFDWNNDPEVRQRSFNPEPILLENHTRWFKAKLEDATCKFYIAEVAGTPAAQIRFDIKGDEATISYLVSRDFRGKGIAHVVLIKGLNKFKTESKGINLVIGLAQRENIASVRAILKAGFMYGTPDLNHPEAYRFVLELPQKV
ncbi:UDP-2,4-diacetamido-2,4,6-trideoxy-beta-L-altropyranose hydrolase [Pontibacter sp. H259]|uniref:UDP-2,4-diacetamido-2,4, 6-trideoxy-beta-L-altropyranose hydrolase n=1 Tax=Pontibacter sp. H259 TaxID=3133421 RepID=UPI0030BED70E